MLRRAGSIQEKLECASLRVNNKAIDVLAHLIHGTFWYRFLSGTKYAYDDAYAKEIVRMLRPGLEKRS